MREATKENLKVTGLALGSIPLLFALVALVEWAGLEELFDLAWWTAALFVFVGVWYGKGLKRAGPLCTFVGAILLHLAIAVVYLRSGHAFPSLFFRIFTGPFEGAAVGALLMLVGGPPRRGRRDRKYGSGHHEPR